MESREGFADANCIMRLTSRKEEIIFFVKMTSSCLDGVCKLFLSCGFCELQRLIYNWYCRFIVPICARLVSCSKQLRLAGISPDELILPSIEAQAAAHEVGRQPSAVQLRPGTATGSMGWRRGELEFEAAMRRLDAAGYRTGHVYRLGQLRQSAAVGTMHHRAATNAGVSSVLTTTPVAPREAAAYVRQTASLGRGLRGLKDVEIPPSASSFGTAYYGDEESR